MTTTQTKKRGFVLTALLVFYALSSISLLVDLLMGSAQYPSSVYRYVPPWYNALNVVQIFMTAVSIYGIWQWKKFGVYTYIATSILSLLVAFFVFTPGGIQFFLFASLILDGLFFWNLYKKWRFFT
jgi:hypothetical protein